MLTLAPYIRVRATISTLLGGIKGAPLGHSTQRSVGPQLENGGTPQRCLPRKRKRFGGTWVPDAAEKRLSRTGSGLLRYSVLRKSHPALVVSSLQSLLAISLVLKFANTLYRCEFGYISVVDPSGRKRGLEPVAVNEGVPRTSNTSWLPNVAKRIDPGLFQLFKELSLRLAVSPDCQNLFSHLRCSRIRWNVRQPSPAADRLFLNADSARRDPFAKTPRMPSLELVLGVHFLAEVNDWHAKRSKCDTYEFAAMAICGSSLTADQADVQILARGVYQAINTLLKKRALPN